MPCPYPCQTKPSIAGFPYDAITDTDWPPTTPVVSILQFSFHFGVDVNDQSQAVPTLWRNSLEYVSTIPGFQSLHWAPVSQSPAQCILVLIQWNTGLAWKRFQLSMGFSLLLGYLSSDLFNRGLRLSLPFDFMNLDCNLEVASFWFSHNPINLPSGVWEYEEKFTAQWDTTFHQVMKDSNVNMRLIASCGGWIEEDYKNRGQILYRLSFLEVNWKWIERASATVRRNANDISTKIGAISRQARAVISRFTNPLKHLFPAEKLQEWNFPSTPVQIIYQHPVLNAPVTRQCNVKNTERQDHSAGPIHAESVKQARWGQRICAVPAGGWYSMGAISQHGLPLLADASDNRFLEIVTFDLHAEDTHAMQLFQELRVELWKLGNCPILRRGIDRHNIG